MYQLPFEQMIFIVCACSSRSTPSQPHNFMFPSTLSNCEIHNKMRTLMGASNSWCFSLPISMDCVLPSSSPSNVFVSPGELLSERHRVNPSDNQKQTHHVINDVATLTCETTRNSIICCRTPDSANLEQHREHTPSWRNSSGPICLDDLFRDILLICML